MALTVDTIRNFTGTAGMQVDRQGNLQEAGKFQGLKSMLNIGDARQRNAETLTAIHHAILNDPRFAAADVRAEATRLLAEIRTDRAIGAAQIRTIMQTLDSLTLDSQASVSARVAARFAATMPPWAAGHEREVLHAVTFHVLKGHVPNVSDATIDVAGRMQEALDRIGAAVAHAGKDSDLQEVLFATLGRTMFNGADNSLATEQKVLQRVDTFRADIAHVNAIAQRSADPAAAKKLGMSFLKELGKPIHPIVLDTLDEFACSLPVRRLGALGPKSTESDILRAIHRMAETVRTHVIQYPVGVEPLAGGDELSATQKLVVRRAIAELPAAAQKRLLATLESKKGVNACAYISTMGGSGSAVCDYNVVSHTVKYLQQRAGKPTGYPGGDDAKVSIYYFSPLARCAFTTDHAINGPNTEPLKAALLGRHQFERAKNPGAMMHEKTDAAAKSMLSGSFATEMKKMATGAATAFDGDISRGLKVILPDGKRVSSDPAEARNQFAQLVTGNPKATYGSLSPADQKRANAFMALITQESESAVERGVPVALSKDGDAMAYTSAVDLDNPPTRSFEISGSHSEGFTIHYQGDFPTPRLMYENIKGETVMMPENLKILRKYEMEIDLTPASLDKVAATDWSRFDATDSMAILYDHDHPDKLADYYNAIPETFRLDMDVSAGFIIQTEA